MTLRQGNLLFARDRPGGVWGEGTCADERQYLESPPCEAGQWREEEVRMGVEVRLERRQGNRGILASGVRNWRRTVWNLRSQIWNLPGQEGEGRWSLTDR